ncbi:DUF7352 domain-containing protein [Streptomyces chartreusis]
MTQIFKYVVPVDDQWHRIESGHALHVAAQGTATVCFWAMHGDGNALTWEYRVIGTGQPLPDEASYVGTVVVSPFVWHLVKRAVR